MSIVLPAVNINGKCKRRKGTIREQFQRDVPDSYMKSRLRPNVCHSSFAKQVRLGFSCQGPHWSWDMANPLCLVTQTVRRGRGRGQQLCILAPSRTWRVSSSPGDLYAAN